MKLLWLATALFSLATAFVVNSFTMKSLSRLGRMMIHSTSSSSTKLFDGKIVNLSAAVSKSSSDFLFGTDAVRFRDTQSISPLLVDALELCNKEYATLIQQKSLSTILSNTNVVIRAETGTGKTLSYLVPLMQKCIEMDRENLKYPTVMVLVPNKELAIQVNAMAQDILIKMSKEAGSKDIKAEAVTSAGGYWPYMQVSPEIVICTPTFLTKFLKGPTIENESLFRAIKHLVLDEADMLLEGSYVTDVEKIMDAFKLTRRQMIRNNEIQVHESVLQTILVAATLPTYGLRSIEKYVDDHFPNSIKISNEFFHKHHPKIQQDFLMLADESIFDPIRFQLLVDSIKNAKLSIDPTMRINCADGTIVDFKGTDNVNTMIFVNTADNCQQLAEKLKEAGVDCAQFHKNMLPDDKQEQLRLFRSSAINVFVCTDNAARGLDLPAVRHVVQAEFALNVVQHLHRIGRASRAGVPGKATIFYDKSSEYLINSILADSEENRIDQSFSRRRGLRKKDKKEGGRL